MKTPFSWRHIEIFHAVMTTQNLTEAADLLKTSQPTVSRELSRLEQLLSFKLFDRIKGRLQPTTEGLRFFEEVQRSYYGLDRIITAANSIRHFHQAELNITCLPGVGACLASAQEENISNLRVMCHDAIEVLNHMIPDNSLQMVQLFFPDPWHKARHNKRRIVQVPFAELILTKLAPNGVFHMATDWEPYAEHMLEVMTSVDGYQNLSETQDYVPRPETRPVTKFEQRGHRLGHGVWDLMFKRVK